MLKIIWYHDISYIVQIVQGPWNSLFHTRFWVGRGEGPLKCLAWEYLGTYGAGWSAFKVFRKRWNLRTQAIITPVIHYCMGGLEIDEDSAVVSQSGKAIPGLYAAGEVAGGVHGNNRLGGNSLLDCVVFGRVAGKHCAKYMLGDKFKNMDLKEHGSLNVPMFHITQPLDSIRYMVYNGYYFRWCPIPILWESKPTPEELSGGGLAADKAPAAKLWEAFELWEAVRGKKGNF